MFPTGHRRRPAHFAIKVTALFLFWAVSILFVLAVRGDIPNVNKQLRRLPLVRSVITQREQVASRARVQTLNYFIPTFEYLCDFIKQPGKFDQNRLRGWDGYLDYYERVTQTFPDMPEGYALAGFFYFQSGDAQRALEYYEMSCQLNPHLFWPRYNAGVLQLRLKKYSHAAASFAKAAQTNPEVNLKFILTSKLYQQIRMTPGFDYDLIASLRQGYQNAAALGQLSQRVMQEPAMEIKTQLELKVF